MGRDKLKFVSTLLHIFKKKSFSLLFYSVVILSDSTTPYTAVIDPTAAINIPPRVDPVVMITYHPSRMAKIIRAMQSVQTIGFKEAMIQSS